MLTEQYQKLVIEDPPPDMGTNTKYGDFVEVDRDKTPVADIQEIWSTLEEQCEESLKRIRILRGEIPVAIHLYTVPHPEKERYTLFGWHAWTLKQ